MSIPDPVVLLDARARYVHPAFEMSRASTKTVFDSAGRLVTVPANAIGWDHDPATGQSRGYLAEPSATNLLLHSNDLTQSPWATSSASVTGDAITGPDGGGMAKLVENSADSQHFIRQDFTITDGQTTTLYCIVQFAERERCRLRLTDTASNSTLDVDFTSDGNVAATNETGGASLVDYGVRFIAGGYYLCWFSGTMVAGATDVRAVIFLMDSTTTLYQGDGTSGLYLGDCQAEEGSYPTSYIETGASTVTRAGDSLVLSGLGDFPWWRSERGTLLVDMDVPAFVSSGRFLSLSDQLDLRWQTTSERIVLQGNNITGVEVVRNIGNTLGRQLIAISWDGEQFQSAAKGDLAGGAELTSSLSPSNLSIGARDSGAANCLAGIRRAVYYPARISNADLQSLTAIQE